MPDRTTTLEDIKLEAGEGAGGFDVVALEPAGRRVVAAGLAAEDAERIAAVWNFCEGFSVAAMRQTTLHTIMDAID